MNFKNINIIRVLVALLCVWCMHSPILAQNIQFPDDAGIINIKEPPYNAKGDGVTDDTQAILNALSDWNCSKRPYQSATIYFPEGTYLVSNTLEAIDEKGLVQSCVRLHGQGTDKTIIKLKDHALGFGSIGSPKPVIRTHGKDGGRGNAGYGNYIQYLTVDVGSGNPGAIGIHYKVSNWGAMSHVHIKSSDPEKLGLYGILIDDISGSGLVRYTSIDGFNYALYTETVVNNIVFDNLKITNQRYAGIFNRDKNLAIYGLESINSVPAILQNSSQAYMALVNARLTGGAPDKAAILQQEPAFLFARNITSEGYGIAIDNHQKSKGADVPGGKSVWIDEWLSHPPVLKSWEDSPSRSLNLPVKDAPEYHTNDFSKWANVRKFGAVADDDLDDSKAIQDAIDSGAEIIYFPMGTYLISDTILVRNNVRKIDFVWSWIKGPGQIEVLETEGDFVIIENFRNRKVNLVHSSPKDLSINYACYVAGGETITNTEHASGDLFITDVGPHVNIFLSHGIQAWIRQLNREWDKMENDGSTVWILGMNMEAKNRPVPSFKTKDGGVTEIIGGAMDPLTKEVTEEKGTLFITENSSISVTIAGHERGSGYFESFFTEIRNGEIRKKYHSDIFSGNGRYVVPLYTGYKKGSLTK